jgi:hypothetical protein
VSVVALAICLPLYQIATESLSPGESFGPLCVVLSKQGARVCGWARS